MNVRFFVVVCFDFHAMELGRPNFLQRKYNIQFENHILQFKGPTFEWIMIIIR